MNKEKLSTMSLSVKFENFQPVSNTGFIRGECKVAYAGENRNYSNIPKETFEIAEPTVYGIPVVGNWLGDNWGGHDILLETKGNEITIKDNTVPYGFVPQDANPRWVSVEDGNGNSKNYYVVDVILWQERYPDEVQFIIDNGSRQSMEIMVTEGGWDSEGKYFDIDNFYYSALCLLGKDVDEDGNKGEKDVEPCFEQSEVIINKFNMTDKFKKDLFAIKSAFEGGDNLKEEKKLEEEEIVEIVDEVVEDVEDLGEVVDEIVEEFEEIKELIDTSEEGLVEDGKSNTENFELSHDDIRSKIFDILNPRDEDGYREWNYWIMEVFQTYVMVVDENESEKYYKFDYTIGEDEEITLGDKTEMFLVWLTQEEKDALEGEKAEFEKLKESYTALLSEVEELREFKEQELEKQESLQKDEIINDYSLLLSEEDIKEVVNEKDDFTLEEIEIKLSKLFSAKELEKVKLQKLDKQKNKDTIIFDNKLKDSRTKKNKFAI